MSNSSLVDYTCLSPNHSGTRKYSITRITPHCVVGQVSVESLGNIFLPSSKQASCNYGIGTDGRVLLCVDEANRSWCSSSSDNDNRAVTIECASDSSDPYAFNDTVYNKLIELSADICTRNGKTKLLWLGNQSTALNYSPASNEMVITVHRWFANKSCPGDWLYNRLDEYAEKVNALLGSSGSGSAGQGSAGESSAGYPDVPFLVKVIISDLNYRSSPSMSGTVLGQTGKGTFTITEVSGDWGKLKSGAGWIYLANSSYCTILGSTSSDSSDFTPYTVQVSISNLNIRAGAGTNYSVVGTCPKGVYTIVDESTGTGATLWGKLKSGAGWISLDYVTKL